MNERRTAVSTDPTQNGGMHFLFQIEKWKSAIFAKLISCVCANANLAGPRYQPQNTTKRIRTLERQSADAGSTAPCAQSGSLDRKSTRLNSSHQIISYAVFCLKKKI